MIYNLYRRLLWHYITQPGEQIFIDRTSLAQALIVLSEQCKEQIENNAQSQSNRTVDQLPAARPHPNLQR